MITQNLNKTIISYQGGSAGDMFTLSCNGYYIRKMNRIHIPQKASLKTVEQKIKEGKIINLEEEIKNFQFNFVNTHLLQEIIDKGCKVLSIVITDPKVQLVAIYRQLQIQKLRMKVNFQDEWFINTRNYCINKKFVDAAEYWFENNKNYWLIKMQERINENRVKQINFNSLFTTEFTKSLNYQGWSLNTEILNHNHRIWLKENNFFSKENTLKSLQTKLSLMNWHTNDGWVIYQP